jgi:deoxyribodipyrimidine photo-lyase
VPAKTAVVLFTRDLRVTDNPALWAASRAERTVPLFVLDEAILGSRFAAPNRVAYMREALIDLDAKAPGTSGTCSQTARSPTTRATGSGWPGPATTRGRSGC